MAARKARSPNNDERKRRRVDQDERRASWIVMEWRRSPSSTPGEMQRACRERFACGVVAAKRAHSRAIDIRREQFAELDLSWFVDKYNDLYEAARAANNINAARRILDSMAVNTGIAKPRRIDATIGVNGITPEKIAHVNVLSMTPVQRVNREAELAARESLDLTDGMPVIDVDADIVSTAVGATDE